MKISAKRVAVCALSLSLAACGNDQIENSVDTTLPDQRSASEIIAAPKVENRLTNCVGYWGRIGDPETDISLSVEINANGKFEVLFSDYGQSSGTYSVDGKTIELSDDEDGSKLYLESCDSAAPTFIIPANQYSEKRTLPLERFKGDYWSEAKLRGIEIPAEGGE